MRLGDVKDEAVKETARHTLRILFRFVDVEELVDDIFQCDDVNVKVLVTLVRKWSAKIRSKHQRDLFYKTCVLGLWYLSKDEAYMDVFRALFLDILENWELFDLDNISKDPYDWHINLWYERQRKKRNIKKTKNLKAIL